jgi:hypothetical protein
MLGPAAQLLYAQTGSLRRIDRIYTDVIFRPGSVQYDRYCICNKSKFINFLRIGFVVFTAISVVVVHYSFGGMGCLF